MEAIDEESFALCRIGIFLARCFVQQFVVECRNLQLCDADTRVGSFRQ